MFNKSYKYQVYPSVEQEKIINKTFKACNFVYNHYLKIQKDLFKRGKKKMSAYDCIKDLTELKKKVTWLNEVSSQALQCTLKDLNAAYQKFLEECTDFPKFKSDDDYWQSYTTRGSIHYRGEYIQIPTLGLVKTKNKLSPEGRILTVTVSKEPSGKYYVSLHCTDIEMKAFAITEKSVGLAFGKESICVISDGNVYKNPNALKQSFDKLAKLQRDLQRKVKGSANYEKARVKVAKLQEKIRNQKLDYLHKLTTDLIRNYDVLYIQELEISNAKLKIIDVSYQNLINMLKYKAEYYGREIVFVTKDVQLDANTSDVEYLKCKAKEILQAGSEQPSGQVELPQAA